MSNEIKIGGCLCGKVEYEFDSSKVISAHHCHCKDCQKSTGSGKATIVMIPEEDLNLSGNLKFYTVTGTAGSHISRGFCEECGSPVISFVEENPGIKFIKAGTLMTPRGFLLHLISGALRPINGHQQMRACIALLITQT